MTKHMQGDDWGSLYSPKRWYSSLISNMNVKVSVLFMLAHHRCIISQIFKNCAVCNQRVFLVILMCSWAEQGEEGSSKGGEEIFTWKNACGTCL